MFFKTSTRSCCTSFWKSSCNSLPKSIELGYIVEVSYRANKEIVLLGLSNYESAGIFFSNQTLCNAMMLMVGIRFCSEESQSKQSSV